MVLPFTIAEAEPLLKTISKIHRVTVVEESPYAHGFSSCPRVCFLNDGPFGMLNPELIRFQGKTAWMLLSDLPRCYLAATVTRKMPAAGHLYTPISEGSQTTIANAPEAEPETVLPSSLDQLRQWATEDMPVLAAYIEQKLDLRDKPSLGVVVSAVDLELPLIEDAEATGNETVTALLTADPGRFLIERAPTSEYDRALHSWITDEEYGRAYDTLHDTPHWQRFPVLARVVEQGIYGVLGISHAEVAELKNECEVAVRDSNLGLTDTLNKILRVCRSAMAYQLGLVIEGN